MGEGLTPPFETASSCAFLSASYSAVERGPSQQKTTPQSARGALTAAVAALLALAAERDAVPLARRVRGQLERGPVERGGVRQRGVLGRRGPERVQRVMQRE